jgi:hypothetical protein
VGGVSMGFELSLPSETVDMRRRKMEHRSSRTKKERDTCGRMEQLLFSFNVEVSKESVGWRK